MALKSKWQSVVGYTWKFDIVVDEVHKSENGGKLGIAWDSKKDGDGVYRHCINRIPADLPVGLNGRLQIGDELLQVNDTELYSLTNDEVQDIIRGLPLIVRIICARQVSCIS